LTGQRALPEGASLQDARNWAAGRFADAGIDEARVDATALTCYATGLTQLDFHRQPDLELDSGQRALLHECVRRRLAREPLTRIIGRRGFWEIDLLVEPDVLDPRADTETLVRAALQVFGAHPGRALRIADLGSGSGAIICALLDQWASASGIAVDQSPQACALTAANARACNVADRLMVLNQSWGLGLPGRFDLVISNPPYIPTADTAGLDPEVRLWDPQLALDGGADGLNAYREIAAIAPALLEPQGWLILETGHDQARSVTAVLTESGMSEPAQFTDLAGHVRALAVQKHKHAAHG